MNKLEEVKSQDFSSRQSRFFQKLVGNLSQLTAYVVAARTALGASLTKSLLTELRVVLVAVLKQKVAHVAAGSMSVLYFCFVRPLMRTKYRRAVS